MILILYLMSGDNSINDFAENAFIIILILGIIDLIIYIAPLLISYHVEKILHENRQMKEEMKEIKNLLIFQNDILNNMRTSNYTNYQQPYNQTYEQYNNNQQRPTL